MEETRGSSPNATGGVAIDSPLQNSRRLEHDDATRRNRHLAAGLRVTADTPAFLEISCHDAVSFRFQNAGADVYLASIKVGPGSQQFRLE
jgi:hypothetical protein